MQVTIIKQKEDMRGGEGGRGHGRDSREGREGEVIDAIIF